MSREQLEFEVTENPVVEVTTFTGDVGIDLVTGTAVTVDLDTDERGYEVEQVGSRITILPRPGRRFRRFGGGDINLAVPDGTDLVVKTTSGDIRTGSVPQNAALGRAEVATVSGDVRLGDAHSDLRVKTASGDVYVDRVGGSVTVATASGDVRIERVDGDVEVTTASGDAHLQSVGGSVGFRSASGDCIVALLEGPALRCKALSGDIRIGIPSRREISLDLDSLAGDLHNDLSTSGLDPVARLRLDISVVSGDVFLYDA
jgi:DUF4097 and DUF4098 domain-containing protein YvlB